MRCRAGFGQPGRLAPGLFLVAATLVALPARALADDVLAAPADSPDYHLTSGFTHWVATPLSGTQYEGFAAIAPRQEFRLSAVSPERLEWLDALGARLPADNLNGLDRPRATYRFTWLSLPAWDFKIGLSTTLDSMSSWRPGQTTTPRFGSLPLMHVSSLGRIGDHWQLSMSADGLRTARGQAVDFDLHVDYSLGRQLAVYGGYRLVDSTGDGFDAYGTTPSSTANLGVRFHF